MILYKVLILLFTNIYSANALKCFAHTKDKTVTYVDCPVPSEDVCYFDKNVGRRGCTEKAQCYQMVTRCTSTVAQGFCCCGEELCNRGEEHGEGFLMGESKWSDFTFDRGTLAAIGCFAAVAVIGLIILAIYCRHKSKSNTTSNSNRAKKSLTLRSQCTSTKETLRENDDGEEPLVVTHEERVDEQVPMHPSGRRIRDIIRAAKNPQMFTKLTTVEDPVEDPVFTKICTFGTSDVITLTETKEVDGAKESSDDAIELLSQLLNHGPQKFPFKPNQLKRVLERATACFAKEPTLIEVPVPCVVYGDLHGQYSDLFRWFNLNGWPHKSRCLFLGDFVDRGAHGVEILALVACLKVLFPDTIYVVRGNHEEELLNKAYTFYTEVEKKFPDQTAEPSMYSYFKAMFGQLPLAALVGGKILGMHGGISPRLRRLQDIREIPRPIDEFAVESLACDLVWSDPDLGKGKSGFRPNLTREPNTGIGQLFAADTVQDACQRLGIQMIIRGHQAPREGYALFADKRLITLFSAPGYKGIDAKTVNLGASIAIDKHMKMCIKQIKVTEEYRKKRIDGAIARRAGSALRSSSGEE